MPEMNALEALVLVGLALIVLIAIGLIFARLFVRASKEIAFVRTGLGGQLVVVNGGALVLPIVHDTVPVNMNTLRLEVARANNAALITKDRMRVDVQAEFYVRVQPRQEAIANAAQTLGRKTLKPLELKQLIEGKFVDALRAVAAEMGMEELHEQRVNFVQKVQAAVSEDLLKNGLELESVSLTALDQTNREYFNPDNAFDAEGLTRLTMEIEEKRRRRNEIERDTAIAIQTKDLEAERKSLELRREQEYARLQQTQEIAFRRADQQSELTRREAERTREAEEGRIEAQRATDRTRIEAELGTNQVRIAAERQVAEDRIETERTIRARKVASERAIEIAELEKRQALELAEQERAIAIAAKSREESEARAAADRSRADAVRAAEEVETVRENAIAERRKQIDLVAAAQDAERQAIALKVAAEAEKQVAVDQAETVRIAAQAEADRLRIGIEAEAGRLRVSAEAEAAAELARAEAAQRRYQVDAAGRRALNEADNALSDPIIGMRLREALLERLPEIIAQSVKPMERIEGIRIFHVDGLAPGAAAVPGGAGGAEGSLPDQMVSSLLRYRTQAPLIDSLLREAGLEGADLATMTRAAARADPLPPGRPARATE